MRHRSNIERIKRYRQTSGFLLAIGCLAFLIYALSYDEIIEATRNIECWSFILAMIAYNLDVALQASATGKALSALGHRLQWTTNIAGTYLSRAVRMASFFFGGIAARILYLQKNSNIPYTASATALIHYQVISVICAAILAASFYSSLMPAAPYKLIAMLSACAIGVLLYFLARYLSLQAARMFLTSRTNQLLNYLTKLESCKPYIALTVLGKFIAILSHSILIASIANTFGHDIGMLNAGLIVSSGILVRTLNIAPAGFGVFEVAIVGSTTISGAPITIAIASATVMRAAELGTLALVVTTCMIRYTLRS